MLATHANSNKLKKQPREVGTYGWQPFAVGNNASSRHSSSATIHEWGSERTESRTMTLARGLHKDNTSSPAASSSSSSTSRNMQAVPSNRARRTASPAGSQSRTSHWQVTSQGANRDSSDEEQDVVSVRTHSAANPSFQSYIGYTTWAVLHPVSAIEHHWALRAARAEALLEAHTAHRRALSYLEEKRSRELAELNERYSQQFASHRRMVWMVMATVVAISSTLLYFLYKHSVPASPHSRWPPSMHFTIPILSPFASVIEHETSAVNVQLVAVLMLAACIFAFLWFRCPPWRR